MGDGNQKSNLTMGTEKYQEYGGFAGHFKEREEMKRLHSKPSCFRGGGIPDFLRNADLRPKS